MAKSESEILNTCSFFFSGNASRPERENESRPILQVVTKKMSSNHIPPPNRPMPGFPLKLFVKSDQALSSSSSKSSDKPKAVSSVLNDGNEVKEFYEKLLIVPDEKSDPQPSGSKHIKPIGQVKQRQSEVVYNQNQLFKAVSSNDIETMTQALRSKNGKEILTSGTDHFGWSPLMVASVSGHTRSGH